MQNLILHEFSTSPIIMFAARAGGVVLKSGCTFLRVKSALILQRVEQR